jgi:hypothetical protein
MNFHSIWLILICTFCFSCKSGPKETDLKLKAVKDSFALANEARKKHYKEVILAEGRARQRLQDSLYNMPMNKCALYGALIRCSSGSHSLKEDFHTANFYFQRTYPDLDSATNREVLSLLSFYKDISSKLEKDSSIENTTKCELSLSFSKLKVQKLESSLCNLH